MWVELGIVADGLFSLALSIRMVCSIILKSIKYRNFIQQNIKTP